VSVATEQDRRGWIIVGAIFLTMFFIWGAINSSAVFFVPIIKYFGWSRTRLSIAFSIGWVTGGAAGPLIGWIADRVNPKKMMMVGAIITGLAYLVLSRATNFWEILAINGLFGICVGASTVIPCSIVIASWFTARRGLAMGIAFAGISLGGAVMTIVANYAIASGGWRFGYVAIALPILVVVVPSIVIFIRTRTAAEIHESDQALDTVVENSDEPVVPIELPGLEISQARRTRSFWMISLAQLLGGAAIIGMGPHFIAYLTGVGYTASFAATVVSLYLVATTVGTLLGGPFADRWGARSAMIATYILAALGMVGLFTASHTLGLAISVVAGGFATGALSVQMPMMMIESLGLKRFGSVYGITSIFFTAGAAVSPVVTGRVFDQTGSYTVVIATFAVMFMACALAISGCRTLEREKVQFALQPREVAA
jgi:MFS family permease